MQRCGDFKGNIKPIPNPWRNSTGHYRIHVACPPLHNTPFKSYTPRTPEVHVCSFLHSLPHTPQIAHIQHIQITYTCTDMYYTQCTDMHARTHARTHAHTHLWWSVARCPSGVVPVELPQHRVAGLYLGHIQGRVVVRELNKER